MRVGRGGRLHPARSVRLLKGTLVDQEVSVGQHCVRDDRRREERPQSVIPRSVLEVHFDLYQGAARGHPHAGGRATSDRVRPSVVTILLQGRREVQLVTDLELRPEPRVLDRAYVPIRVGRGQRHRVGGRRVVVLVPDVLRVLVEVEPLVDLAASLVLYVEGAVVVERYPHEVVLQ